VAAPNEQSRHLPPRQLRDVRLRARPAVLSLGETAAWAGGLVLAVSSFTSWYSGHSVEGPTLSVTGWNSGTPGKLVFLVGVGVVCLAALRRVGLEFPSVAEPLIVIALGALATVFVLIRVISIPDAVVATGGRSIGLWISLASALVVIAAGLLQAAEEL
jgi:hypothetical protein